MAAGLDEDEWVEKTVDNDVDKEKKEELSEGELSEEETNTLRKLTSKLSDEERKVIEQMLAKKKTKSMKLLILFIVNSMVVCRAGFKKQKVIRNFCEIVAHFVKVICYCELLFAVYLHFCIIYIKCV